MILLHNEQLYMRYYFLLSVLFSSGRRLRLFRRALASFFDHSIFIFIYLFACIFRHHYHHHHHHRHRHHHHRCRSVCCRFLHFVSETYSANKYMQSFTVSFYCVAFCFLLCILGGVFRLRLFLFFSSFRSTYFRSLSFFLSLFIEWMCVVFCVLFFLGICCFSCAVFVLHHLCQHNEKTHRERERNASSLNKIETKYKSNTYSRKRRMMAKNNNDNRNALTQNLNEFSLKIVCNGSTDNSYAMPHGKSTAESTTVQYSTVRQNSTEKRATCELEQRKIY